MRVLAPYRGLLVLAELGERRGYDIDPGWVVGFEEADGPVGAEEESIGAEGFYRGFKVRSK